jgi:hypothetical protein
MDLKHKRMTRTFNSGLSSRPYSTDRDAGLDLAWGTVQKR